MQDEPESQIDAKFDDAFAALQLYDDSLADIEAEVTQATRTAAAATRAARATPTARATD